MSGYFTALFRAADADANGLLEASELKEHLTLVDQVQIGIKKQMIEASEAELTGESLEKHFLTALESVENADHFKSVVTADENKMIKSLFKSIDTNDDGVIDLDEMKVFEDERKIKHDVFIALMEDTQKAYPEGLTEEVFTELAYTKLTEQMMISRNSKSNAE